MKLESSINVFADGGLDVVVLRACHQHGDCTSCLAGRCPSVVADDQNAERSRSVPRHQLRKRAN